MSELQFDLSGSEDEAEKGSAAGPGEDPRGKRKRKRLTAKERRRDERGSRSKKIGEHFYEKVNVKQKPFWRKKRKSAKHQV